MAWSNRTDIVASVFSAWLVFGNGIGIGALGKRRYAVGIVSVSKTLYSFSTIVSLFNSPMSVVMIVADAAN